MTLKILDVNKSYEGIQVLDNISIEIRRGEVFGLFGVINAGKSVLIRILAGIENLESGKILFDEEDITECASKDRDFHFPDLSNESFWKTIFKTAKASELGDGEGQILAMQDALSKNNSVLLLDNSFCFMDKNTRRKNYFEIRNFVRKNNSMVVFATNDFEEVFRFCDRVAVIYNGKIVQVGTPREVYEFPKYRSVAEIVGENNLISAKRLTANNADHPEFCTLDGEHRITTAKFDKNQLGAINQEVTLAIRPENISINFGASFPEDNLIKAKVMNVQFMGKTTTVILDAGSLILKATVLRLVGLKVGEECMVGLPPDKISIFA